jgi:hypothetical protein
MEGRAVKIEDPVLREVAWTRCDGAMLVDPSYLANPPLVRVARDLGMAGNYRGDARLSGGEVTLGRSRICWHDALAGQAGAGALVGRE